MVGAREALADLVPREKARLMYRAYDIIGDIVVTKIPSQLERYELEVGKALQLAHPSIKKVFRVIGETEEVERNRRLRLIWPESLHKNSEGRTPLGDSPGRTVYIEHGCRFIVDVERVFFTPRLSHERMRIATQVKAGEVIANLFGGVGTYAIIIARVCPDVGRVYTVDVNPFAHELAEDNAILNKCSKKVIPILGDAREVCRQQLRGLCDRVIMPLPGAASSFLDIALITLKKESECTINFYATVAGMSVDEEARKVIDQTRMRILGHGAKSCQATGWRVVREVGPRRYHIAVDFRTTS